MTSMRERMASILRQFDPYDRCGLAWCDDTYMRAIEAILSEMEAPSEAVRRSMSDAWHRARPESTLFAPTDAVRAMIRAIRDGK